MGGTETRSWNTPAARLACHMMRGRTKTPVSTSFRRISSKIGELSVSSNGIGTWEFEGGAKI